LTFQKLNMSEDFNEGGEIDAEVKMNIDDFPNPLPEAPPTDITFLHSLAHCICSDDRFDGFYDKNVEDLPECCSLSTLQVEHGDQDCEVEKTEEWIIHDRVDSEIKLECDSEEILAYPVTDRSLFPEVSTTDEFIIPTSLVNCVCSDDMSDGFNDMNIEDLLEWCSSMSSKRERRDQDYNFMVIMLGDTLAPKLNDSSNPLINIYVQYENVSSGTIRM
jgi:hypothetical protein